METEVSDDTEVQIKKQHYRIEMIKMARLAEEAADPDTREDLSNVPPHLLSQHLKR
jgi:hypothetical protein